MNSYHGNIESTQGGKTVVAKAQYCKDVGQWQIHTQEKQDHFQDEHAQNKQLAPADSSSSITDCSNSTGSQAVPETTNSTSTIESDLSTQQQTTPFDALASETAMDNLMSLTNATDCSSTYNGFNAMGDLDGGIDFSQYLDEVLSGAYVG